MANACAATKTLLTTYWLKANTDNRIPRIVNAMDETDPTVSLRTDVATDDFIKIYEEGPEHRRSSGIGNQGIERQTHISIDVNSGVSQIHALKILGEVERILENHHNSPGTGFDYIMPDKDVQNFSGTRYQRMWRWVISITLLKTNAPLGT